METRFSPRAKLIAFWLLVLLALVLLARVFEVLTPFLWAIVTAYIFRPLLNGLVGRTRLPRRAVAVAVYFFLLGAFVLAGAVLWPVVRQQAVGLLGQLPGTVEAAIAQFEQRFPALTARLGLDTAVLQSQVTDLVNQASAEAPRTALAFVQKLFHLLIELFVYLIATFFFFLEGDRFLAAARRRLPRRYHREADRVVGQINATLGAYLRGQLLLVAIMSSVTFVALTIYDLPYAIVLALATGFLELIPILGPWSAGAIAVSVAAFDPTPPFGWSNLTLAIAVGITYFVLRQLEDVLVIPTLIGRIVHLHPLLVIFCLLIGTAIGGVLGLLLAVPTAAVVKILLQYIYGKLVADVEREVVLLDDRAGAERLLDDLPRLTNRHLVLLPRPGLLGWEDLPLVQRLALEGARHGVGLSVVTADPVAGSLATAVGLDTTVIPAGAPLPGARPSDAVGRTPI
jgi:predicted PurR-regulated permease PerM